MLTILRLATALTLLAVATPSTYAQTGRWSKARVQAWQDATEWMSGCNFNPSNSINQLEMWQAATFDTATISRELGWAADLGFNVMRVYLHYLPWEADAEGYRQRIDQYLAISERYGIRTMFVLFDNCWYGDAKLGPQPDPVPGFHNSYWLQCPRYAEVFDSTRWPVLEQYTRGVLEAFGEDERVVVWDLYNEPGANHRPYQIMPLLEEVVRWARESDPSQPLTMGVWVHAERESPGLQPLMAYVRDNSDVITFHHYGGLESLRQRVSDYASFGRPVLVTEYLARGNGSTFDNHLPYLRERNIGAINWGLVTGKTQTMYGWGSPYGAPEPEVWHHDILRADGEPFSDEEVELIKRINASR